MMCVETIQLSDNEGMATIKAASSLRKGGVILYPTDTLYGLGADAFSDEAVDKVYEIKGRDKRKPMHAVFADIAMIGEYAEINDVARKLIEKFLPGPLTLVLKKKSGIKGGIARGMETVGVRIPDNSFCIETARSFGKPFTTTSANVANHSAGRSVEEILQQLAGRAQDIDLVIDAGLLPQRSPSTVVDVSQGKLNVLRVGPMSKSLLESALKST